MKYRELIWLMLYMLQSATLGAQVVQNPKFNAKLQSMLSLDVNTIDVTKAADCIDEYVFLDAREIEEYQVSHIQGAKYIGYENIDEQLIAQLDKSSKIIVYCSVGYRSEKITKKLNKEGFKAVYNLYGSLFEWANQNQPLYDKNEQLTDSIHTYNRSWSQWVDNPKVVKIW